VRLGVVGHAAEKFTVKTEREARQSINDMIDSLKPTHIVSGRCHMGGIDVWAEEIAAERGLKTAIYEPRVLNWSAEGGFMDRNLAIAKNSDAVLCVVVADYPKGFKGKKFDGCYHCKGLRPKHCKSGGCWTAMHCRFNLWALVHDWGVEWPPPARKLIWGQA
jgi:hypothetical protein